MSVVFILPYPINVNNDSLLTFYKPIDLALYNEQIDDLTKGLRHLSNRLILHDIEVQRQHLAEDGFHLTDDAASKASRKIISKIEILLAEDTSSGK